MSTGPRKQASSDRPHGRTVVLAFAVAVVAAVALIVVALVSRSDTDAAAPTPSPSVSLTGIPQDDRVLGDAAANVVLIEYADPQCPACRSYSEDVFPTVVDDYVRPGTVKTEFRGFPFIGPDSVKALRFIYAAGLQDKLWEYQEALYRNQGGENDGWVTDELLRQIADEIPGLDADKLFADAASTAISQEVAAAPDEAQAAGVSGTPSLFVKIGDAEPYFIQVGDAAGVSAALDDAIAG
jgi:protein-disulfide isomerase